MDFTEINSRGKRGELLRRIDRQNSRFGTSETTIIEFGLPASSVQLESAKSAFNENYNIRKNAFYYNGDSMETQRNVGETAKLASFLDNTLATWRLNERC
ncbi:hypothetical protein TNCV_2666741 [Trichonephila clavipes]|nr:hypothetical protein TNCV_2666741 [Trichonephila clavipes]